MHRDRRLLYAAAFVRALAVGMTGVVLGVHLASLGLAPAQIGAIVSAGLAGCAAATALAMWSGDRVGRRRFLTGVTLVSGAGGVVFALLGEPTALAAAAFLAMLNGMGRDRGAALVIEQAALPSTVDDAGRTGAFARYNVVQDAGHALGALLAGVPLAGFVPAPAGAADSFGHFVLYGLLLGAAVLLYLRLSPAIEVAGAAPNRAVSPASRRVLTKISALFALDSLGGGFLTTALLAYFFFERFGAGAQAIALLFFGARVLNALSHLGAAWLARRIGLVNTMVFTHVPSSLLLVTVAIAPNFSVAALLFLLREGLVEMDVPTRQSYVMAVVRPEERTFASGVTHLVRLAAWAAAPWLAGLLMGEASLAAPLVAGAALKLFYDGWLYFAFRGIRPPEERA